jgi:hypothetical protein
MVRIRRFGVVKTATVSAAMYFVLIVVFVLLLTPFVAIVRVSTPSGVTMPGIDPATGFLGVLVFGLIAALIYAIIGWIFTAIACLLYNFVAGFVGGIEVQLEQVTPAPVSPAPDWGPPASTPGQPPPTAPTGG